MLRSSLARCQHHAIRCSPVPDSRSSSRAMFWRIVRRLITANRGRLFVILLALAAGAAITAALLNLQIDAKRRLTTEFRSFGANVIIAPKNPSTESAFADTIPLAIFSALPNRNDGRLVDKAAFLYTITNVSPADKDTGATDPQKTIHAVVVGYGYRASDIHDLVPGTTIAGDTGGRNDGVYCEAGEAVAKRLGIEVGAWIRMGGTEGRECEVTRIDRYGGPEDNQIFADLDVVDKIINPSRVDNSFRGFPAPPIFPDRVNLIQLGVPGTPESIERYIAALQKQFPDVDVHGIRQFSEAQAKIYAKISGLLTATVVLVLILTALCVMAAMTNVAMERRNDVGLMKAIGGATRRVLRLFLTEAALLGLSGGLIGAAVGIALSIGLGKAVFGVAARPRLIVYPIAVGLTIIVAIAS